MTAIKSLYMLKGRITVAASGYWFTAGGEKGSFGYYPHLKDRDGFPVFPDTQIKGDLKMAARWLMNILAKEDQEKETNASASWDSWIKQVFGDTDRAMFHITDLELTAESKKIWTSNRFQVKPRIKINETRHTVEDKMLVDREFSYLEGLCLSASFFIGYFGDNTTEWQCTMERMDDIVTLLSGFGGFRSRGFGRGTIRIDWIPMETVRYMDTGFQTEEKTTWAYELVSLVNFRHKPVEPGTTQSIESANVISGPQMRAWFVKTYSDLFSEWPSPDQMKSIRFSSLYPSTDYRAFPPPMSTLRNEDGMVQDMWGYHRNGVADEASDSHENFLNSKSKPLPPNVFVTNEKPLRMVKLQKEHRLRNFMNDDFITRDDGLFVQELIRRKTLFRGQISIEPLKTPSKDTSDDFTKRALFIIRETKPLIKGCVFEPAMAFFEPNETGPVQTGKKPYLVVEPLHWSQEFSETKHEGSGQITIDTMRRYNTALRRPRRNRIVVKPGSILVTPPSFNEDATVCWQGFGETLQTVEPDRVETEYEREMLAQPIKKLSEKEIPRSQVRFLKQMLHPSINETLMRRALMERKEKFDRASDKTFEPIVKKLLKRLDESGVKKTQTLIRWIMDELHQIWWEEKHGRR